MEVDDNRANGGVGGSPANLHRQSGCIAADTSGTVLELVDVCEEFLFKFISGFAAQLTGFREVESFSMTKNSH